MFATLSCCIALSAAAAHNNGWYAQAQATRGHQLFNNYCAQCHGPELAGAAGPALVGDAFLEKWSNKPLDDLLPSTPRVRVRVRSQIAIAL